MDSQSWLSDAFGKISSALGAKPQRGSCLAKLNRRVPAETRKRCREQFPEVAAPPSLHLPIAPRFTCRLPPSPSRQPRRPLGTDWLAAPLAPEAFLVPPSSTGARPFALHRRYQESYGYHQNADGVRQLAYEKPGYKRRRPGQAELSLA